MLIFLHGPDSYRRKQKINELREGYRTKGTPVLEASFDLLEGEGFLKFKTFRESPLLFYPFRVAVIENAFAYEDEKSLIELLENVCEDKTIVCIVSEGRAPRKSLAFLTKKPVLSQQFKPFSPAEFKTWMIKEAGGRGLRLREAEMQYFALNYSSDLWGAITELDAFALQKKEREMPREHDLLHADFFELASLLRIGGAPRALFPVFEILLEREDPARIFNFLAYRARPEEKPRFADYDVAVKSGKLDYDTALLDVLIR